MTVHDAGHRDARPWSDLAHALVAQNRLDLTAGIGHDADRDARGGHPPERGHALLDAEAPDQHAPHARHRLDGVVEVRLLHSERGEVAAAVHVPVEPFHRDGVVQHRRLEGVEAGVVRPVEPADRRRSGERLDGRADRDRVGHHEDATRVEEDGVEARATAQVGERWSPARSPREMNFSAILRLASSIISSPNITAPLPSPSVACA